MLLFFLRLTTFLSCLLSTTATSLSTLHTFPPGTWVENLAITSNGNLLTVLFSHPEIHQINPFTSPPSTSLIARFGNATGIQGIAEIEDGSDVFAVMPFQGSDYALWTVDLRDGMRMTEVIPRIEGVGTLNGLTRLADGVLLASDTKLGAVIRLDLRTRSAKLVVEDETMIGLPLVGGAGINGIRVHEGYVYYTNFLKGILCRVPVHPVEATRTGPVQVLASGLGVLDDLAVTGDGVSYVMQYFGGTVARVGLDGGVDVVAGGLDRPTSAQFGRTVKDAKTLYVSSSGNPLGTVFKPWFEGGKVYAINLD